VLCQSGRTTVRLASNYNASLVHGMALVALPLEVPLSLQKHSDPNPIAHVPINEKHSIGLYRPSAASLDLLGLQERVLLRLGRLPLLLLNERLLARRLRLYGEFGLPRLLGGGANLALGLPDLAGLDDRETGRLALGVGGVICGGARCEALLHSFACFLGGHPPRVGAVLEATHSICPFSGWPNRPPIRALSAHWRLPSSGTVRKPEN
jgi:hypothetical protein